MTVRDFIYVNAARNFIPYLHHLNKLVAVMADPLVALCRALSNDGGLLAECKRITQELTRGVRASQKLVNAKELELGLEISQLKFSKWKSTWIDNSNDIRTSSQASELLWGNSGWDHVQELLRAISEVCNNIERQVEKINTDGESIGEPHQQSRKSDLSLWRRWLFFRRRSIQDNLPIVPQYTELRKNVTELSKSMDELWTFSENTFESRHGAFGQSLESSATDSLLTLTRKTRVESLALYRFCKRWKRETFLNIDLGGTYQSAMDPPSLSHFSTQKLCYRVLLKSRTVPLPPQQLCFESVRFNELKDSEKHGAIDSSQYTILELVSRLASSKLKLISMEAPPGQQTIYFFLTVSRLERDFGDCLERFSQLLTPPLSTNLANFPVSLPIDAKVGIAYKIVECGFFLLWTPWLSNLNSRNLFRVTTSEETDKYILETKELDLEDPDDTIPVTPANPSQVFQIGVLLAEVAIGSPLSPFENESQALDRESSRILSLVERSMPVPYVKATAFCLKNWRAERRFNRSMKSDTENDTELESSVTQFLEKYFTDAVLQLDRLRSITSNMSMSRSTSMNTNTDRGM